MAVLAFMPHQSTPSDKDNLDFKFDFFISRRSAASATAQEVSQVLEDAGFKTIVQDFDFPLAENFVSAVHNALLHARNFIGLLTEDYATSPFTRAEWTSFFALAAKSDGNRRLIILRIDNVDPPGLLAPIVYGDLYKTTDAQQRREIILAAATGRSTGARQGMQTFYGVPPSNRDFTGRDDLFDRIHDTLNGDTFAAITQAAIHGLGGVGKTSLAAEYAHRSHNQYAGVWWVPAENETVLIANLAALAEKLDPRFREAPTLKSAAEAGLARLSGSARPWLLVYDNVRDPLIVDRWTPRAGARILITTRFPDWVGRAAEIKIGNLDFRSATVFLLRRADSWEEDKAYDLRGAARLAKALGYLPLALDHAGAYVKATKISFARYRELLGGFIEKVPSGVTYPVSVAATFVMALESATRNSPLAGSLLGFYSVLAPDRIPAYCVNQAVMDELARYDATAALSEVSLIQLDNLQGVPAATVHRLVQLVMREQLAKSGRLITTLETAISALVSAYPRDEFGKSVDRPRHRQILPHAVFLRSQCEGHAVQPALLGGLDSLILLLQQMSAHIEIEEQYRSALALSIETFSEFHTEVAKRHQDLADFLRDEGHHGDAEQYYRKALDISQKALDRADPTIASRMIALADLQRTMGRLDDAQELLQAMGPHGLTRKQGDPRDVISHLNALGNFFRDRGNPGDAEPLFRECVKVAERQLGRSDPYLGTCLSNLGAVLTDLGEYAEARTALDKALNIKLDPRTGVGEFHLGYAISLGHYAKLQHKRGLNTDAEDLFRQAIRIAEATTNGGQPHLGRLRAKYSLFLSAVGREAAAVKEAEAALASHDNLLGLAHAWTKEAAIALVDALIRTGEMARVRDVCQRYRLPLNKSYIPTN